MKPPKKLKKDTNLTNAPAPGIYRECCVCNESIVGHLQSDIFQQQSGWVATGSGKWECTKCSLPWVSNSAPWNTPDKPKLSGDPIIDKVPEIFAQAQALLYQRSQQYNKDGATINDYMPFGTLSYVQMVHVKALRLVSVSKNNLPPKELKDSALDIINYAAFLLAYLEGLPDE